MGLHYQRMSERVGDSPIHTILQRLPAANKNRDRISVLSDNGSLLLAVHQMPARARRKLASMLDGWVEYSCARSELPPPGVQRLLHVARQLFSGHYHRYGHGLGSAFRDLRRQPQRRQQKEQH
jgi:hypothetical protein